MMGLRQRNERVGCQAVLAQVLANLLAGCFSGKIREFPETGQQTFFWSLVQGVGIALAEKQHRVLFNTPGPRRFLYGEVLFTARFVSQAECGKWAAGAVWRSVRQAYRSAEVHKCLIERAG